MAQAKYEHSTDSDVIAYNAISVHQQFFTGQCSFMEVIHFTAFYNLFNLPKTELSPTMLEGLAGVTKYLDEIYKCFDKDALFAAMTENFKKEKVELQEVKQHYEQHLEKMKKHFGLDEGWTFFLKVQNLKFGYAYDYQPMQGAL